MSNQNIQSYGKPHADVLEFMLTNNCKVEQESIKAVELLE